MTYGLWLKFPKPAPTGDWFTDTLPDPLPTPGLGEVLVDMHVKLILKTSEGPMASQVGSMMDVIAGIARTGGAVAGRIDSGWTEKEITAHPKTSEPGSQNQPTTMDGT